MTEQPLTAARVMTNRTRSGTDTSTTATLYTDAMRPTENPTDPSPALVSKEADGSMLTDIGGTRYLVAQFDSRWAAAHGTAARKPTGWQFTDANGKDGCRGNNLPGTMLPIEAMQGSETGNLTANATTTPRGPFISSEEIFGVDPSGRRDDPGGRPHLYHHGGRRLASPYRGGISAENTIGADGAAKVVKHFTLGR